MHPNTAAVAKMQNNARLPLIVAAGGTGGDLFPVLAIVEHLSRMLAPHAVLEPVFVGNQSRIEGRIIPARGYRFVPIPMRGYYGARSVRTYSLAWRLPISIARVAHILRTVQPRVALLAGTYVSLPVAIAARWANVPIVLVEINAIPGKVNRIVARWAERIFVSVPACRDAFPPAVQERVLVVGTPIRPDLRTRIDSHTARGSFGFDPDRPVLLVLGGSLGAQSLNSAVEAIRDRILAAGWQILWQTGANYSPPLNAGIVARPFIEDMASAYAAAELVLSRAGGSTVAELAALGKAAILVPYPHAANREQHHNAQVLAQAGGAVVIEDASLSVELWPVLEQLLGDDLRRHAMANAARTLGVHDATERAAGSLATLLVGTQ
ncbi:MAG: undecaprenyldiphospho-muramoylpentapeptide beta-N-acetylglucosaminyltransferase [Chlorobiota bacterium]|nr:MAG: undecaprenyldiphospho-muramoylpentapeptide beta-N-acetylglucosaminyltransferase [Chlorobiota bacterium]